ncbi:MAG: nucleotidyltransferase [Acetatifactor sp.]
MKINGIIAEYNPFHNGHKYHLETTRRLTGADYTVAVISGNFVQRGGPALTDKHTRAEMALRNGADLVLELPPYYATASAECFAYGAVAVLEGLGLITNLSFGSECGNLDILSRIASLLAEEPEDFTCILKSKLCEGLTFPAARAAAISRYFSDSEIPAHILSSPNNILGIEYLKALFRLNSSIVPLTIKRHDSGYHSDKTTGKYCSASALRKALLSSVPISELTESIPGPAAALLSSVPQTASFVCEDDFSEILYYKLLSERDRGYEEYPDVSRELSDRIRNRLSEYRGFNAFCNLLKTKELTYTRVSRCLLHIMLDLKEDTPSLVRGKSAVPYVRVLGFQRAASELLSCLSKSSSIPIITRLADAEEKLSDEAFTLFQKDLRISQLYLGVAAQKRKSVPLNEYTHPMVII